RAMVGAHLSPQLTLTAAILMNGGFEGLGRPRPRELVYVKLSGGRKPGEIVECAAGEAGPLAREVLAELKTHVTRFDDPATPYVSWARPQYIPTGGGDYDHLARLWEWSVVAGADEGGAD
ncbi:MAG: double-strand break repair protein AddB, partial [Caulobacteraceae bacterium]|nr:double-strand break repair protein AddB [Caulobacteraceae bacterium]